MTWTAEKQAARYRRLVASHRCVVCSGGMLPEWSGVRCPSCVERQSEQRSTEAARAARRPRAAVYQRGWYAANRERAAADQRKRREAKKLRGECTRCIQPAAEDSNYCADHRERERARVREQARRRRARASSTAETTP